MPSVPAEALLAFLRDPESYPHRPEHVHIIQTHISYVAIASPYVYKIKKPVSLGFLDFSTLSKRKFYCGEEVRLNRRLCAAIYEGVVPIFQPGGKLSFEGGGDPVEYAVHMKELEDGHFLHQLVEAEQVRPDTLDRLAKRLVAFYTSRKPSPEIAQWGRVERLRVSTDENFEQTVEHVGTLLSQPAFEALRFYVDRFIECNASLFARRRVNGRIVEGHGDLRAEHVHITPDRICIYDCIEFNERLRFIDIANDVAFLTMDLDNCGRPDLSSQIAGRLTEALDDSDLPKVLTFYKCYRAYVRGKVEGMRVDEPEVPNDERAASCGRARRYYRLALGYAVAGGAPLVIVTMGRVGTGKSTLAQALSDALGWPVVASDRTRKDLAGVPANERVEGSARTRLYARDLTHRTYKTLTDTALARARDRHSTILDATYSRSQDRDALRKALEREGVAHRFIEFSASDETIRERLRSRQDAANVVSDARLEDFDQLNARYVPPGPLEDPKHLVISSEHDVPTTTLNLLRQLIRLTD